MKHNNHSSGTHELGELKRPPFPKLSDDTNISGKQALKEAQTFTIMNDVFCFLHHPFINAEITNIKAIVDNSKQKRIDDINKALAVVEQRKNAKKQHPYILKEFRFQKKIKKWKKQFPIVGLTHEEDRFLVKKTRYLESIEYFDNDNYIKEKI
jgi:hypothetical protein